MAPPPPPPPRARSNLVGGVVLGVWAVGFVIHVVMIWHLGGGQLWSALGLRRLLRLKPSPSERFADVAFKVGGWVFV